MKICRYLPISFLILLLSLGLYILYILPGGPTSEGEQSPGQTASPLPQPSEVLTEGPSDLVSEELLADSMAAAGNEETPDPINYAGTSIATSEKTDTLNKEQTELKVLDRDGQTVPGFLTQQEKPAYDQYLREVLAPALEETQGLKAPHYMVRDLDDAMIRELVSRHYGKIILKAKDIFFLAENVWQIPLLRPISNGDLDGYSHRALQLHSQLYENLKILLKKDYIYSDKDILVFLKLTDNLDRLILAKQFAATKQMKKSFSQVQTTEGRLIYTGKGYSYLVENVVLQDKTRIKVQDLEKSFLKEEE